MLLLLRQVTADDWPQYRGPQRDGVWRETGIVQRLPKQLDVRWSAPVALGYAGPAVAEGRVFVSDYIPPDESVGDQNDPGRAQGAQERITCFDAQTGKQLWQHAYPCLYKIGYAHGPAQHLRWKAAESTRWAQWGT